MVLCTLGPPGYLDSPHGCGVATLRSQLPAVSEVVCLVPTEPPKFSQQDSWVPPGGGYRL